MKFLIDNALSPRVADGLRSAGHDAVHIRDINMQRAADTVVMALAVDEQRVIVSADTDFGTLLAQTNMTHPSVILLRRTSPRQPTEQVALLLANLPAIEKSLRDGCIVIIEQKRIRVRPLPIQRPDDG